jgi:hypothetical protein
MVYGVFASLFAIARAMQKLNVPTFIGSSKNKRNNVIYMEASPKRLSAFGASAILETKNIFYVFFGIFPNGAFFSCASLGAPYSAAFWMRFVPSSHIRATLLWLFSHRLFVCLIKLFWVVEITYPLSLKDNLSVRIIISLLRSFSQKICSFWVSLLPFSLSCLIFFWFEFPIIPHVCILLRSLAKKFLFIGNRCYSFFSHVGRCLVRLVRDVASPARGGYISHYVMVPV